MPNGETGAALESFAAEVGSDGPVAVVGGRTHWEVGGPCPDDTRLVRAPSGVRSFDPADMTIRVGAGTLVEELDAVLAEAGQRANLPIVPEATVGGVLVVGRDDVHALGRGRLRDVLLEAVYVAEDGRLVKVGGPTVKNVSGFDLCRLLVGSLGTLGLVGEVILRTWPRPAVQQWLSGPCDPAVLRRELYWPSSILWDGQTSWVHLEGHESDVESEAELARSLGCNPTDGPPSLPAHRVPTAALEAGRLFDSYLVQFGTGSAYVHEPFPLPEPDPAVVALHRRLKAEFDPRGRLNPGRDPLAAL
ncbi:MAG: FAD-binding protein [Acidimicrobiia bacterium]|nr:FAD-binding protein [Acidimicrobiia bacterium]MYG72881.1 FAD-binding protein [Acidimicrobiia bacterium]MYH96244.1 FAD-binding protein [Acidimicrobiia bacterium]MYL09938.1 FAD-binding protein [Acidimicrobiia bacterium]